MDVRAGLKGCALVVVAWLGACTPSGGGSASSTSSSGGGGADASVGRDSGPPDAADGPDVPRVDSGPGCGAVTESGQCDGNTLRYCRGRTVVESDCASRGRVCGLQTNLGGFWCVGARGATCEVNETDVCETGVPCVLGRCGGLPADAGPADASALDASTVPADGGPADASPRDASQPTDAARADARDTVDAAMPDSGTSDASRADAATVDAGLSDAS
jgi:hypothetical protein